MCAMLLGDFEAAWRISDQGIDERRRRGLGCVGQPLHLRWVWDGTPLVSPLAAIPGVQLVSMQHGAAPGELLDSDILERPDATTDLHQRGSVRPIIQRQSAWKWSSIQHAESAGEMGDHRIHADDEVEGPTMRLFRQPAPGEWTSVIQQIAAALHDRVRGAGAG
jgi:hypothetical protein